MRLLPIWNQVSLRMDKSADKTSSLIVPDAAKPKPTVAIIIALGPDAFTLKEEWASKWPRRPRVGDRIVFSNYSQDEFKIGGQDFLLVKDEDVLALVAEDDGPEA